MDFVEPVLWEHQKQAVELATSLECFAFLFDCGTGKTLACIKTLRNLYSKDKIFPTLILAPIITLQNWKDEWMRFSKIPSHLVHVLVGPSPLRIKILSGLIEKHGPNVIVITNYDILSTCKDFVKALHQWGPQALVIDESQRIKSLTSKRTKEVIRLAGQAKHKFLLSGTPILNSPMDIFPQWLALDNGDTFGKNFYTFRATYFEDKNARMSRQSYFPNWQIRPSSYETIKSKISQKSLRAKKEDCLDLPPLVRQKVFVELGTKQRKHYDEMLSDFITFIDDQAVSADLVLTKMLRLLQITTGHVSDEAGNMHTFEDNPRMAALEEILTDLIPAEEKVIIWCIFKENYTQVKKVCEKIGAKYVELHGSVSTTDKYNNVNLFNSDRTIRVFIGHPLSVGIGINLIAASYSIVYSRSYSLEQDLQSEARNYRAGSERHQKITKIDIVAKDTVDEAVLNVLENKLTDANKIVNIIKSSVRKKCS